MGLLLSTWPSSGRLSRSLKKLRNVQACRGKAPVLRIQRYSVTQLSRHNTFGSVQSNLNSRLPSVSYLIYNHHPCNHKNTKKNIICCYIGNEIIDHTWLSNYIYIS